MPSAYIDAAQIVFPPACPHCGQAPDTTRAISAHRTLYAILSEYVPADTLGVPVCRASARRRTRLGVIAFVANIAFILVGGFFTMMLVLADHKIEAGVLGAGILTAVALARTGWDDALLDSRVLGVRARRVAGPGRRVRVTLARDEYFSEWAAMNPGMSTTAGVIGWRPPPPVVAVDLGSRDPIVYSRAIPAFAFAACTAIVALHHWYAVSGGHPFVTGVCLLTAGIFLSFGGLVYPPVFWSISSYGRHLPLPVKIIGATLALAGLAAGFLLVMSYSEPKGPARRTRSSAVSVTLNAESQPLRAFRAIRG